MKEFIGIGIFILLIIFAVYGIRLSKKNVREAKKIKKNLIEKYLYLIQNKQYEEAYKTYVNVSITGKWSKKKFIEKHSNRNRKYGNLVSWEVTKISKESNIFSKKSFIHIYYRLHFEQQYENVLFEISTEDKNKIEMTYKLKETSGMYADIF